MKLKLLIGVFVSTILWVPDLFALSVDEAYKAIPHQQTTFNRTTSNISSRDKIYLSKMFSITDQAMAARVEQLSTLYYFKGHGDTGISAYNEKVGRLVGQLEALNPPGFLKKHHQLILESIQEQKQFFNEWASASDSKKNSLKNTLARHPLVQSSHHKLFAAYNELMRQFPQEIQHNKQAFFDHLCALDFL
jgi:hypothetical protein